MFNYLKKLAAHSDLIFAIDIDTKKINFAKDNCTYFKVSDNIEFIQSDYFSINNIQADLAFLNPTLPQNVKKLDLLTQCEPNLLDSIIHSYKLA